jgi:hypothetical protein
MWCVFCRGFSVVETSSGYLVRCERLLCVRFLGRYHGGKCLIGYASCIRGNRCYLFLGRYHGGNCLIGYASCIRGNRDCRFLGRCHGGKCLIGYASCIRSNRSNDWLCLLAFAAIVVLLILFSVLGGGKSHCGVFGRWRRGSWDASASIGYAALHSQQSSRWRLHRESYLHLPREFYREFSVVETSSEAVSAGNLLVEHAGSWSYCHASQHGSLLPGQESPPPPSSWSYCYALPHRSQLPEQESPP